MKITKLWEFPISSQRIGEEVKITINGIDQDMEFLSYNVANQRMKVRIGIIAAFCYLHTSETLTNDLFDAYEVLVQIEDSDWLIELKKKDNRLFEICNLKHYAIYFDSIGMYQFIAMDFTVDIEEV